ncbi:MAG: DNA gyrase inhibitor YacG [Pirellula sp.]|nr:DNA gyrase inhibitor YacG [Pirellula sp.]
MTTESPKLHCPTCHRPFVPDLGSAHMPFCSVRCKMADLNRWFDEDIGLPVHASTDDEEDEGPEPPPPQRREWNFD